MRFEKPSPSLPHSLPPSHSCFPPFLFLLPTPTPLSPSSWSIYLTHSCSGSPQRCSTDSHNICLAHEKSSSSKYATCFFAANSCVRVSRVRPERTGRGSIRWEGGMEAGETSGEAYGGKLCHVCKPEGFISLFYWCNHINKHKNGLIGNQYKNNTRYTSACKTYLPAYTHAHLQKHQTPSIRF